MNPCDAVSDAERERIIRRVDEAMRRVLQGDSLCPTRAQSMEIQKAWAYWRQAGCPEP